MGLTIRNAAAACAAAACVLSSAACHVNGDAHLFRVGDDARLHGPWAALEAGAAPAPVPAADDPQRRILRWCPADASKSDTFSLTFDRAFFKYLPDLVTTNEVIVVFRFVEGAPTGENEDVRILGPLNGIADGSLASAFGQVMYGPKPVDSDALRVHVQIWEYDSGENEQTSQFIGFVADAAKTFQLANPATLVEIELARTIADTLVGMNGNDLVFEARADLLPQVIDAQGQPLGGATAQRPLATIPLRAGTWGLIRQEKAQAIHHFFHFTKETWAGGGALAGWAMPFAVIGDVVMLPFTGINRAFLDSPTGDSLAPITSHPDGLRDDDKPIGFDGATRTLVRASRDLYDAKTWLLFTIEAGRPADDWERRKELRASQQTIDQFLKGGRIDAAALQKVIGALEAYAKRKDLGGGTTPDPAGPDPDAADPDAADPDAADPDAADPGDDDVQEDGQ